MLFEVELKGFDKKSNETRNVDVPDNETPEEEMFKTEEAAKWSLLNSIWHYGQNDFQPKSNQRSLMVGDVIRAYGRRFRINNFGFSEIKS